MNRNDKITLTCPPNSPYANCVRTEVIIPEFSPLLQNGCYNVQEIEQDLYTLIGDIKDELDLTTLSSNTTGYTNTAIGISSGSVTSDKSTSATNSNNSIFLGYRTSPLADNQTNQVVIGHDATGLGSNTTVIGNGSTVKSKLFGVLTHTTYTVATLPTGVLGDYATVTNALSPSYLATVVGGGSVACPVFFNGTNWVCH